MNTKEKNSIMTSTSSAHEIPFWHKGVPESYHKDPTYFRNYNVDDFCLDVREPNSSLSNNSVTLTTNGNMFASGKDKIPRMPLISFPPCRVRYPYLHKTGDFPSVKDKEMHAGKFKITIAEGDVPQDMIEQFPELVREQTAAFDFIAELESRGIDMFYKDKRLRSNEKESFRKMFEEFFIGKDQSELEKAIYTKFKGSASIFKGKQKALVRPANESINSRHIVISKHICVKQTSKNQPKKTYTKTGDPTHHIDILLNLGYNYNPPCIKYKSGKGIVIADLGNADEPFIGTNDIIIPTFCIKAYDTTSFGFRALYMYITLKRGALENEKIENLSNHTEDDQVFEFVPLNMRKAVNLLDSNNINPDSPQYTQTPNVNSTSVSTNKRKLDEVIGESKKLKSNTNSATSSPSPPQ